MHIAYAGFLLWNRMNTLSFWNTNISPLLSLYAKFNSRFRANNYRVQKFFYRIKVKEVHRSAPLQFIKTAAN